APLVLALGGYALAKQPNLRAAEARDRHERVERALEDGYLWLDTDSRRAVPRFEEALAIEPRSPEAIAGLCFAAHRPEERLAILDRHADAEREHRALRRVRARVLRDARRAAEARPIEAELGPPRDALERFLDGRGALPFDCAMARGSTMREALDLLASAVRSAPAARFLYHAEWAHAAGHVADADVSRHVAAAIESLWPASSQAWSSIGLALGRVDFAESNAAHRKAIELDPRDWLVHDRFGDQLFDARDFDGAHAEFAIAREAQPDRAVLHHKIGSVLIEKRDLPAAIASYRRALELDPGYSPSHNNLALVLEKSGDKAGAIAEYRRAIELEPRDALARANLANVLHQSGDLESALVEYRRAVELDRESPNLLFNYANALRDSGDDAAAIETYQEVITADPGHIGARSNLALRLYETGREDDAIELLRRAVELDPTFAIGHANLGSYLASRGDLEEGLVHLRRAHELDPSLQGLVEFIAKQEAELEKRSAPPADR
ncbi:MAG TPA: tetratricopeptide repeat protein, partial [Planctomycetota bacterium]|nr:tetratricopeptide repeat protein [Planctomycetota bacterium]